MKKFLFEIGAIAIGCFALYWASAVFNLSLNSVWSAVLGAVVAWPLASVGEWAYHVLYAEEEMANLQAKIRKTENRARIKA